MCDIKTELKELKNEITELKEHIFELHKNISKLETLILDLNKTCGRMDNHISFVDQIYMLVRSPLNWIINKIQYMPNYDTDLPVKLAKQTD